jgi:uncharacterized protein DUF6265
VEVNLSSQKLKSFCFVALAFCTPELFGHAPPVDKSPTQEFAKASLTDFEWLSGHWVGGVEEISIEEFCSKPDRGLMMCMFRSMDTQKTLALEIITLQNKPDGVEERIRFLSPDLAEGESAKTVVLKVTHMTPNESVFENPEGSYPKRVTLTRNGPDEMTSRIELIDEGGKPALIEAHWKRSH